MVNRQSIGNETGATAKTSSARGRRPLLWGLLAILMGLLLGTRLPASVAPPRPLPPLPSPAQMAWQELEYYAFVHFGMNTFTGDEWGKGQAPPSIFQPTALDTRQWARVAKAAGMKGIILTAKHHDGFCLWPSQTTRYTVAQSSWRNGTGDVLRDLSEASREAGLKFGVYLSPWDRNHPDYGTPRYNRLFKEQWREVLTGYGEVFESWLDGANDHQKRMVYDFPGFFATIKSLQPQTIIFSDAGPDIRWVGNEKGFAGETNWSTFNNDGSFPGFAEDALLGVGEETGPVWLPAECDVSIRPGWFYHTEEDQRLKTVEQLMEIYYGSVGRNANLLLNIGVDQRGLVHPHDEQRLLEFRSAREAAFRHPRTVASITASQTRGNDPRYRPEQMLDADPSTWWATDDGQREATLDLVFDEEVTCDKIRLQEPISMGQRIRRFSIETWTGKGWQSISQQTTIGYQRIVRFPTIRTQRLRIRIEDARAEPLLSTITVYGSR
jgi:alpha-L-fucosidase